MNILAIRVSLSKKGFNTIITEYEVDEKEKIYVLKRINDEFGDTKSRHLRKEELNKLRNRFNDSNNYISRAMFCFENQKGETIAALNAEVIETFNQMYESIKELKQYV